jgi:dihydrodipicolinate synthase/N-acetylneuraminate lyase
MYERERAKSRLEGCYVTVPTMFRDSDLELDCSAIKRHVGFLSEGGLNAENAVLLTGGAAGDFSTMSIEERLRVAEAVIEAADGRFPIAVGAQTTSTRELVRIACAAEKLGAEYIQVSCPYYFSHTEQDFYEYVLAAAEAAPIGLIVYNTFWTSSPVSLDLVGRLLNIENFVGLKWAAPRTVATEFERAIVAFSSQLCVIDNQLQFASSHMMGARGFEVHVCNYWPEWGASLIALLQDKNYTKVQSEIVQAKSSETTPMVTDIWINSVWS